MIVIIDFAFICCVDWTVPQGKGTYRLCCGPRAQGALVPGRIGGQHHTGGCACLPRFTEPNGPPLYSQQKTKPQREHAMRQRQALLSCHFPSLNYREKLTLLPVPNSDAKSATLAEARSSASLCWDLRAPKGWAHRGQACIPQCPSGSPHPRRLVIHGGHASPTLLAEFHLAPPALSPPGQHV